MIINTNVSSITAQEAATNTGKSISSSLEKLSTGLKINKASDDASGLAIADKLRTQATSIDQGVANGNSAVTLLQIADKSMAEQSNILDTVKAKLIQANTDTTSSDGREAIKKDISKLLEQLDNIAKQTNYNGTSLLQAARGDNSESAGLSFQVGESDTDLITNTAIQSNTAGLGGDVSTVANGDAKTYASGDSDIIKTTATSVITVDTTTATDSAKFSVSGIIGTITAGAGNLTISDASASDVAKLKEMIATAGADDDLVDNGDGTFTIGGGTDQAVDFGGYDFNSITLTADVAGETVLLTANALNDKFSIQNIGEEITATATTSTFDSGITLSSLKDLPEGGLTTELADIYQSVVDTSISNLNAYRGDIGSTQNQVESAVRNLMTQSTNVQAAESIIRDVDYAAESANFNKQNIISQAGSYAISQANSVQQNVLKLLQ
jgi:flagellin